MSVSQSSGDLPLTSLAVKQDAGNDLACGTGAKRPYHFNVEVLGVRVCCASEMAPGAEFLLVFLICPHCSVFHLLAVYSNDDKTECQQNNAKTVKGLARQLNCFCGRSSRTDTARIWMVALRLMPD